MPVSIHGKQYITVAERVQEAGEDFISLDTQVLQFDPIVVVKAIVVTKKGTFTGISAANPLKAIEKASPYEVAETSAVGRALGFAGYGIIEGIASADEMVKATAQPDNDPEWIVVKKCSIHDAPLLRGVSKVKFDKEGNPKTYWYHMNGTSMCFGHSEQKENTE